jgi:hypothetical protein
MLDQQNFDQPREGAPVIGCRPLGGRLNAWFHPHREGNSFPLCHIANIPYLYVRGQIVGRPHRETSCRVDILLPIYLVATPASPAEITLHGDSNAAFIGISGMIQEADDKKFIELARNIPGVLVLLNSLGGYSSAALNIGSYIRSRSYGTVVVNGATCNSACPLVWLAGAARYLARYVRLGFHSAAFVTDPLKRNERANAAIAIYMKSMARRKNLSTCSPWQTLAA